MTPYAGFTYFGVLLYVGVPTLALGFMGRLSWRWVVAASVVMLAVQYGGIVRVGPFVAVREIWMLLAYALVQVAIAKGFHMVRGRGTSGSRRMVHAAVVLAVLPLAVAKFVPLVAPASQLGFLGISYVTFRSVDVILGIQDRLIPSLPTLKLLAFLFFFPAISSGPIDRYRRFTQDWDHRRSRQEFLQDVDAGVHRIFTGFLYKFVIAALVKQYWLDPASGGAGLPHLVSYMYAYSFYLFFDFAGYSAFAIGVSYLFGVHSPENFNRPFLASNIRDFWNRWHMSLSHWFRDHVYMRYVWAAGKGRWFKSRYAASHIGLFLSMGLMGLWHGAAWYFLLYGLYHASLLVGYDVFSRWNRNQRLWGDGPVWRAAGVFVTFNLVCFGFLLFSGRLDAGTLKPRPKAVIEIADCRAMSGWVVDDNHPEAPVTIDLYDDSVWLATIPADRFRQELAEKWRTKGRHGFEYRLPASVRDGKAHAIYVKASGTETVLGESPRSITCDNPGATIEGIQGRTYCGLVSGWLWDRGQPDTPLSVDIHDGGRLLATVPADTYRPGLAWWKGKGYHGFEYGLPPTVMDGRPHVIRATLSGTDIMLQGGPKSITCPRGVVPMEGYEGALDGADCTTITGWARDTGDPQGSVDVDLYDGKTVAGTARAAQFRPDLEKAGLGGRHAFSFAIPTSLRDGRPHAIMARVAGSDLALAGSPKSFTCPATPASGSGGR